MRRNSKRHSKKHVSRNKRHSRKRHSRKLRGNRFVLVRNRRGMRRNMTILGIDPINQVAIPGAYAVGGLMLANAAGNAAAAMPAITNVLDAGRPDAIVTKSLVGAGVAGLALFFSGKLPTMLRQNITPIVAGMGCAVAVRLLRGTPAAPYLGRWGAGFNGFGEYVDQPLGAYVQDPSMGEYVDQPLGEYVDQPLGEYVDQPLGGLGATMYAAAGMGDQDATDNLLDGAEASAGVGVFQAAAGMGQTMYAAAGMGEMMYAAAGMGADGTPGMVGSPIPLPTFTPARSSDGRQQPPFVSMETPIDMARQVTAVMDRTRPVKTSMVTSEGRTGEGGIFSRSIFGGSMG